MCKYVLLETKENVLILDSDQCQDKDLVCNEFDSCQELILFLQKKHKIKSEHKIQQSSDSGKADCIFIKDKDYFRKIKYSDILWIEAAGSYCVIFLADNNQICLSYSLSEIIQYIPEKSFLRIHRSYIVNIVHIDAFTGNMIFVAGKSIPVSKTLKSDMINKMNVLGYHKKKL